MRKSAPLCLALALFASGCSVQSLIDKSNKEAEKTVDIICGECGDLFPDFAECEDLFGDGVIRDDECTIDALELDASASRDTLNCLIDAQKDYNKCLEDNISCTDPTSWQECSDIISDATDTCPELPTEVQEALSQCG